MRKTILCLLLALACVAQVISSQAQEATVALLQPKANGHIVRVVRTPVSPPVLDGQTPAVFKDELLINGQRTPLPAGENYEGAAGIYVLTSKVSDTSGKREKSLRTYTLENGALRHIAEIPVDETYAFHFLGADGNVLISDEYEGLGYEIQVYSLELKKLSSYRPFGEVGFLRALSYTDRRKTVFIFFPSQKGIESKMVLMESNTGNVVSETRLSLDYVTNVVLKDNMVLVQTIARNGEGNRLIGYDVDGNVIWRLDQTADALLPVTRNGSSQVFVMDHQGYRFVELQTGLPSATTALSSIAAGKIGQDYKLDVVSAEATGDVLLLVSRREAAQYQHEVFRIDASDKAEKIKSISTTEAARFTPLSNAVLVTDAANQIIYTYEK